MPQPRGDIPGRYALRNHHRGGGMPQSIERDRRQVVALEDFLKDVRWRADAKSSPVVRGEYGIRLRPVLPEWQSVFKLRAPVRGVGGGGDTKQEPDDPFLMGFNDEKW